MLRPRVVGSVVGKEGEVEGERFPVKMHYYGTAAYADLAPVLDELESRFGGIDLTVSRLDSNSKVGGAFSIALALTVDLNTAVNAVAGITAAGAVIYAKAFLEELGKQDAKALRQKLLRVPVLNPVPHKGLSLNGLSVRVGTVQFYIDSPMTEPELASALQQAAELVATMPEGRVNNPTGASGWPVTWDSTSQSWRDSIG
jgi:hypothetical protein